MRKVLALLLSLLMLTPALAEETVITPLPMGLTDTGYTPDPNAFIAADEENGGYSVDVPVIVGLNDANYEKSLNDSLMQQMQDYITAFMAEENTADSLLQVQVTTGFCTKDFLSILWEGTRNGMPVRFAKNLDLLGQKAVTLADMLTQTSLEAAQAQAGEDWTAEQFYLTADGELILIGRNAEGGQTIEPLKAEQSIWRKKYKGIFTK